MGTSSGCRRRSGGLVNTTVDHALVLSRTRPTVTAVTSGMAANDRQLLVCRIVHDRLVTRGGCAFSGFASRSPHHMLRTKENWLLFSYCWRVTMDVPAKRIPPHNMNLMGCPRSRCLVTHFQLRLQGPRLHFLGSWLGSSIVR